MAKTVHQGDVLKLGDFQIPVLVVSTDFFNETEFVMACPVTKTGLESPLHIEINTQKVSGFVRCEDVKKLDTRTRGFSTIDHIDMASIIDITDTIQGIFDYI